MSSPPKAPGTARGAALGVATTSDLEKYNNSDLTRLWRVREAQLLRLLSAKTLDNLRKSFEGMENDGLSPADFVRVLMRLVGHLMLDREELCVQILELFTNIDVNGDGTLEWDELLSYVLQTTAASVKMHGLEEKGVQDVGDLLAMEFKYQRLKSRISNGDKKKKDGGAGGDDDEVLEGEAASWDEDVVDTLCPAIDKRAGILGALGFKRGASQVDAYSWVVQDTVPRLVQVHRYRHGTSLTSHRVIQATFVPELALVVTCSQEEESGLHSANFFDYHTAELKKRLPLECPCSTIVYYQPSQVVLFFADTTGVLYAYDIHTLELTRTVVLASVPVTAAVAAITNTSSGVFVGFADGSISLLEPRTWRPVPNHSVLAHEFGVKSLVFSEKHNLLISIGKPHPYKLVAVSPDVYAVLLWPTEKWLNASRARTSNSLTGGMGAMVAAGPTRPAAESSSGGAGVIAHDSVDGGLSTAATDGMSDSGAGFTSAKDAPRPKLLMGHQHPPTSISLQEDLDSAPHLVSCDASGCIIVWGLLTGQRVQQLQIGPPHKPVTNKRGRVGSGLRKKKKTSADLDGGRGPENAAEMIARLAARAAGEPEKPWETPLPGTAAVGSSSSSQLFPGTAGGVPPDTVSPQGSITSTAGSVTSAPGMSSAGGYGTSGFGSLPPSRPGGSSVIRRPRDVLNALTGNMDPDAGGAASNKRLDSDKLLQLIAARAGGNAAAVQQHGSGAMRARAAAAAAKKAAASAATVAAVDELGPTVSEYYTTYGEEGALGGGGGYGAPPPLSGRPPSPSTASLYPGRSVSSFSEAMAHGGSGAAGGRRESGTGTVLGGWGGGPGASGADFGDDGESVTGADGHRLAPMLQPPPALGGQPGSGTATPSPPSPRRDSAAASDNLGPFPSAYSAASTLVSGVTFGTAGEMGSLAGGASMSVGQPPLGGQPATTAVRGGTPHPLDAAGPVTLPSGGRAKSAAGSRSASPASRSGTRAGSRGASPGNSPVAAPAGDMVEGGHRRTSYSSTSVMLYPEKGEGKAQAAFDALVASGAYEPPAGPGGNVVANAILAVGGRSGVGQAVADHHAARERAAIISGLPPPVAPPGDAAGAGLIKPLQLGPLQPSTDRSSEVTGRPLVSDPRVAVMQAYETTPGTTSPPLGSYSPRLPHGAPHAASVGDPGTTIFSVVPGFVALGVAAGVFGGHKKLLHGAASPRRSGEDGDSDDENGGGPADNILDETESVVLQGPGSPRVRVFRPIMTLEANMHRSIISSITQEILLRAAKEGKLSGLLAKGSALLQGMLRRHKHIASAMRRARDPRTRGGGFLTGVRRGTGMELGRIAREGSITQLALALSRSTEDNNKAQTAVLVRLLTEAVNEEDTVLAANIYAAGPGYEYDNAALGSDVRAAIEAIAAVAFEDSDAVIRRRAQALLGPHAVAVGVPLFRGGKLDKSAPSHLPKFDEVTMLTAGIGVKGGEVPADKPEQAEDPTIMSRRSEPVLTAILTGPTIPGASAEHRSMLVLAGRGVRMHSGADTHAALMLELGAIAGGGSASAAAAGVDDKVPVDLSLQRSGLAVYAWTQDVPDREPVVAAFYSCPSLAFVTVSASAITVWDALSGRPLRVTTISELPDIAAGGEFSAATIDDRQRKLIVGDTKGNMYVVNLQTGTLMKTLDPEPVMPFGLLGDEDDEEASGGKHPAALAAKKRNDAATAAAAESVSTAGKAAALRARLGMGAMPVPAATVQAIRFFSAPGGCEAVGVSGRGTIWICDESTLDGWQPELGLTTIARVVPIPEPVPLTLPTGYVRRMSVYDSTPAHAGAVPAVMSMWNASASLAAKGSSASAAAGGVAAGASAATGRSSGHVLMGSAISVSRSAASKGGDKLLDSGWPGGSGMAAGSGEAAAPPGAAAQRPKKAHRGRKDTANVLFRQDDGPIRFAATLEEARKAAADMRKLWRKKEGAKNGGGDDDEEDESSSSDSGSDSDSDTSTGGGKGAGKRGGESSSSSNTMSGGRVTAVAVSTRLNLVAAACSLVEDWGRVGRHPDAATGFGEAHMGDDHYKTNEGAGDTGAAPASSTAIPGGHVVLIYDFKKCSLLGACANHEGFGAAVLAFNIIGPGASYSVPPTAAWPGATTADAGATPSAPSSLFNPQLSAVGPSAAAGAGLVKNNFDGFVSFTSIPPARLASYTLPPATTMQFLDPLAALLTAHEDGSLRIWAMPPGRYPFTCRMVWHVPDAVIALPPELVQGVMRHIAAVKSDPKNSSNLNKAAQRLLQGGKQIAAKVGHVSLADPNTALPATVPGTAAGAAPAEGGAPAEGRGIGTAASVSFSEAPDAVSPTSSMTLSGGHRRRRNSVPALENTVKSGLFPGSPKPQSRAGSPTASIILEEDMSVAAMPGGAGAAMPSASRAASRGHTPGLRPGQNTLVGGPGAAARAGGALASVIDGSRASTAAELADSEEPIGIQHRYATCTTALAGGLALPMTLGALAPTGHSRYVNHTIPAPGGPDLLESTTANMPGAERPETANFGGRPATVAPGVPASSGPRSSLAESHALWADMRTSRGELQYQGQPACDEGGMVIWAGDSDGEIHRWFISRAAVELAGLEVVAKVDTTDGGAAAGATPSFPLRAPPVLPYSSLNFALALSHRTTLDWWSACSKEDERARRRLIGSRRPRGPRTASMDGADGDGGSNSSFSFIIPITGEVVPPVRDINDPLAFTSGGDAGGPTGPRIVMGGDGASSAAAEPPALPTYLTSVGCVPQLADRAPPRGVVWEGSWRAHGRGEVPVSSLQVVHDSGLHAVLSAAPDGLARIWDSEGRLLGTLDPHPRFMPPKSKEQPAGPPGTARGRMTAAPAAGSGAAAMPGGGAGPAPPAAGLDGTSPTRAGGASSQSPSKHAPASPTAAKGGASPAGSPAKKGAAAAAGAEEGEDDGAGAGRRKKAIAVASTELQIDPARVLSREGRRTTATPRSANGRVINNSSLVRRFMGLPLELMLAENPEYRASNLKGSGLRIVKGADVIAEVSKQRLVVYGPARGSGHSFDAQSMVHVCRGRVYDSAEYMHCIDDALKIAIEGSGGLHRLSAPPNIARGAASLWGELTRGQLRERETLDDIDVAVTPVTVHIGDLTQPIIIPLRLRKLLAALARTRKPGDVTGAASAAAITAAAMAATAGGEGAPSSGASDAGGAGGAGVGEAAMQTYMKSIAGDLGLGDVDENPSEPHFFAPGLRSSVLTLVRGILRQRRVGGLRYAAGSSAAAPPPEPVVWHVSWDLRSRYAKQLAAAREAYALVAVLKLREATGWGVRSSQIATAAQKLGTAFMSQDVVSPLPKSYLSAFAAEVVHTPAAPAVPVAIAASLGSLEAARRARAAAAASAAAAAAGGDEGALAEATSAYFSPRVRASTPARRIRGRVAQGIAVAAGAPVPPLALPNKPPPLPMSPPRPRPASASQLALHPNQEDGGLQAIISPRPKTPSEVVQDSPYLKAMIEKRPLKAGRRSSVVPTEDPHALAGYMANAFQAAAEAGIALPKPNVEKDGQEAPDVITKVFLAHDPLTGAAVGKEGLVHAVAATTGVSAPSSPTGSPSAAERSAGRPASPKADPDVLRAAAVKSALELLQPRSYEDDSDDGGDEADSGPTEEDLAYARDAAIAAQASARSGGDVDALTSLLQPRDAVLAAAVSKSAGSATTVRGGYGMTHKDGTLPSMVVSRELAADVKKAVTQAAALGLVQAPPPKPKVAPSPKPSMASLLRKAARKEGEASSPDRSPSPEKPPSRWGALSKALRGPGGEDGEGGDVGGGDDTSRSHMFDIVQKARLAAVDAMTNGQASALPFMQLIKLVDDTGADPSTDAQAGFLSDKRKSARKGDGEGDGEGGGLGPEGSEGAPPPGETDSEDDVDPVERTLKDLLFDKALFEDDVGVAGNMAAGRARRMAASKGLATMGRPPASPARGGPITTKAAAPSASKVLSRGGAALMASPGRK